MQTNKKLITTNVSQSVGQFKWQTSEKILDLTNQSQKNTNEIN